MSTNARGFILKVTKDVGCVELLAGDFLVFNPDGKPTGMIRIFDADDAESITELFGLDRTPPSDAPDHAPDVISILDHLGRK